MKFQGLEFYDTSLVWKSRGKTFANDVRSRQKIWTTLVHLFASLRRACLSYFIKYVGGKKGIKTQEDVSSLFYKVTWTTTIPEFLWLAALTSVVNKESQGKRVSSYSPGSICTENLDYHIY